MGYVIDQTIFVSSLDDSDGCRLINLSWGSHFIKVFIRALVCSIFNPLAFVHMQLSFTSPDCTYHICPPTRALMEYTPGACCVLPNPIRSPLLLCSGYIGRFVWISKGQIALLGVVSFRSGYNLAVFFIRSFCFSVFSLLCLAFRRLPDSPALSSKSTGKRRLVLLARVN